MRYRSEIDGLRAVAVLPVIFFHAGAGFFSGGYVGVDVFFVISGYLITTIILTERQAGRFSIVNFYERRARRILPALFVVVFACLPFAWRWMTPDHLKDFSESIVGVSLFYSNVFFWLKSGYFETAAELKPLLHTWSLAVEEQYYLLFPLFVMLTWRFGKRVIFALLTLIGLASLMYAHWGALHQPSATFFLLPTRLWELLVGSLAAFYLLYGNDGRPGGQRFGEATREILSAAGLLLIVYSIVVFDEHTPFPSLYALAPTIGTALIILFASDKTRTGAFLSNRALVGIGLISYSAYLWHQPLFAFGRLSTFGEPGSGLMTLLGIVALGLAYVTWRYVEQPFRNKQRFSRHAIFRGAFVLTLALGLTGFTGQFNDGSVDRYSAGQRQMLANIERLKEERRMLMRSDQCHFTERHEQGVEYFLENWDCRDTDVDDDLQKIPVIVVGDSHAADVVVALRMNGYEPLQIGGSGCSLNPDYMTRTCAMIFDKLFEDYQNHPDFKYIVLANRFSKNELSMQSMRSTIDYWQRFGFDIAIFTALPHFNNFEKAVMLARETKPNLEIPEFSERDELVDYLARRAVHVINGRNLFCSLTPTCGFLDENRNLLLVDGDHFSREGARLFGEQLVNNDSLFSTLR